MSSNARTILIDDSDTSKISYSGNWVTRTHSQEHGGSSRGSATANASATLKFTGNSIQVVGTIPEDGEEEEDSRQQAVINFSLDSVPCPAYIKSLPEEADLFSQTVLKQDVAQGEHTLVISLNTTSPFPTFYLDYILVTTSGQSPDKNDLIYVDDGDALLDYEGSWTTGGSPTTHRTRDSTSRVSFNFTGTYVNVVGSASRSGTRITLDNSIVATAQSSSSSSSLGSIYEKDGLSEGEHSLVLSSTSNDEMSLDYVLYRPTVNTSGGNGSNSGGNENPNGTSGPKGSSGSNLSGGAIAGIVIGAIAGLGLLLFAVVWFFRRSKRRQLQMVNSEDDKVRNMASYSSHTRNMSEVHSPFLPPVQSPVPYSDSPVSPPSSSSGRDPPLHYPASRYTSEAGSSSVPMTAPSALAKVEQSNSVVLSWSPPAPVVHEDAGVRLDGDRDAEYREELPPAYRPYYPSRDEH